MTETYTTGTWTPTPGATEAFIDAWSEFAAWASAMPGAATLRLVQDIADPDRYVSFGAWDSIESVRQWKATSEFRERIARVLEHVAEFHPTELMLVASASDGATTVA